MSVSAIKGGDGFGTVQFTLPLVPVCIVCVLGWGVGVGVGGGGGG